MDNQSTTSSQIFDLLEGTWKGEGRGQFPTVTSFDYHETLVFTRRDEKILAYEQRTQKLYDGQTEYLQSHWESGFISTSKTVICNWSTSKLAAAMRCWW